MKILLFLFLILSQIFAQQTSSQNFAQQSRGLLFSGIFESAVSANVGDGEANPLSYGLEEYANIRMQSRIGDVGTFFAAVNLLALAGDYALAVDSEDNGKNYIAIMELERLYFKLKGRSLDFDGGLLRMPFGYGQVWKSSDFLNPANPLKPDARPLAVLGGGVSWYPVEDFKILAFGSAGDDPFENNHAVGGMSADKHWNKASIQVLYAFEQAKKQTQRIGGSFKADLVLGLVLDALYSYNEETEENIDGLSFSGGFDYSLFGAKLVFLVEYLYNGASSSTSETFSGKNYLYGGATWRFSDFTSISTALMTDVDENSHIPIITFSHELFQGATLALMAQIPIDSEVSKFYLETKLKFRF